MGRGVWENQAPPRWPLVTTLLTPHPECLKCDNSRRRVAEPFPVAAETGVGGAEEGFDGTEGFVLALGFAPFLPRVAGEFGAIEGEDGKVAGTGLRGGQAAGERGFRNRGCGSA
jgi:hypothetical protein